MNKTWRKRIIEITLPYRDGPVDWPILVDKVEEMMDELLDELTERCSEQIQEYR